MDGAKGSALEWALALLHAPGKRHALRHKPLPSGIDLLLGIAAGAMPEQLADAARIFGESEQRVREAAQFYVKEVMFFPQADAYRVLGVQADASNASIKTHHRLLQHWLHPDRLDSEDDAVFAARVNAAWNSVRNPERRQAYDKALLEDPLPESFDGSQAIGSVRTWIPDVDVPRNPWRHRLPMLALSAACILLVVLVVRDMRSGQDRWDSVSAEGISDPLGDRIEISVPHRQVPPPAAARTARIAESANAPPVRDPALPPVSAPVTNAVASRSDAAMRVPVADALASSRPLDMPPVDLSAQIPVEAAPAASPQKRATTTRASARDLIEPLNERMRDPASEAEPLPRAPAMPSYARIRQAWSAGDQLLRYMGGVGRPPPPIWSSPGIQSSADLLRQDMHGAGGVRLSGPQWQIGEKSAVLTSGYAATDAEAVNSKGRLTADLIWRDDRWLVVGLSLERAQ
jgi:hypothetical protein